MESSKGNQTDKGKKWFWPVMLIITAIALLWIIMRSCSKDIPVSEVSDIPTPVTPQENIKKENQQRPVKELTKIKLGNTELEVFKDGVEVKLIEFLSDINAKAPESGDFDFDDLTFDAGSARLRASCKRQIKNVATILKAHPNLQIKICGYTDASGNEGENQRLSQDRANAVVLALKALDVNGDQFAGAEGFGSRYAKAKAEAPEEERAKDRRVAIVVTKK